MFFLREKDWARSKKSIEWYGMYLKLSHQEHPIFYVCGIKLMFYFSKEQIHFVGNAKKKIAPDMYAINRLLKHRYNIYVNRISYTCLIFCD